MIALITGLILVVGFILAGNFIPAIKKFLSLLITYGLKLLSFSGIKIRSIHENIKLDNEFIKAFPGIKTVKISNKNLKIKSSIAWIPLSAFLICTFLVIINLDVLTGNAITKWLYNMLSFITLIRSPTDMNTLYTAGLFSIISFSLTKVFQRWKETKSYRIERKNEKIKEKAIKLMTTKEMLDAAKKKDLKVIEDAK